VSETRETEHTQSRDPLAAAVIAAAGSFRPGAKINIHDIRLAAAADGVDINHVDINIVVRALRTRCDPLREGNNHYAYWVRKW